MEEKLVDVILSKKDNIGSLCLYIQKRDDLKMELESSFNEELRKLLTTSQKVYSFLYNNNNIFCNCGKLKKWKDFKSGWRETCGDMDCIVDKRKSTNFVMYGVDNPMKNKDIRKKANKTNLEKYGHEVATKNENVRNKISEILTNRNSTEKDKSKEKRIKNWENKNADEKKEIIDKRKNTNDSKSENEKKEIINKRKNTCLNKYGTAYAIMSNDIRDKIIVTFNKKYNGNTPFASLQIRYKSADSYRKNHIKNIKEKLVGTDVEYISHFDKNLNSCNIEYTLKCNKTNDLFKISYTNLRVRLLAGLEISPFFRKEYGQSEMENDLYNFVNQNYIGEIIRNVRDVISPMELDIYMPELKLAFEFNGLYWHSEIYKNNDYHLNKTELCEEKGIHLIQIYEDDWTYRNSIVKSRILNLLNKTPNKILARKTEIEEIDDNKVVKDFLEKNHIQGFVGSKIKIGLFYNNELVSLMTFGHLRKPMNQLNLEGVYEMLRFCNKNYYNVVGGSSKLLSYFLKKYFPREVISYADRSWSSGNLYEKLGFDFSHKTEPNYYYIIGDIRKHRFNYRKDRLIKEGFDVKKSEHEIMLERGCFRIYDSGSLKFSKKDFYI